MEFCKAFKRICLIFLINSIVFLRFGYAATYYMSTTGKDTNAGTESAPWLTLSRALPAMSGGDTLIIENGTYRGAKNRIGVYDGAVLPPTGSPGAWTTIRARNDGGVVFDGENARWMFYVTHNGKMTNHYWKFQGLTWGRTTDSTVFIDDSAYVKFINCGAYDAPGTANYVNFSLRATHHILIEGCYAYGSGRYKFCSHNGSSNNIFRNCVGRMDYENTNEPMAIFVAYGATDVEFQNCIAIDSDQIAYYTAELWSGSFFVPSTSGDATRINFTNCIALNNSTGGFSTTGNQTYAAKQCKFTNCIVWDSATPSGQISTNLVRGIDSTFNHCTFGGSTIYAKYFNSYDGVGYNNNTVLNNSLFYGILNPSFPILADVEIQDYNAFYGNTATRGNTGAHDITNTNFMWSSTNTSGGIKYLVRVESNSNISGIASDGGDIGANVLTLVGTSGTLWGETGYNTDTGVSMWPFPNEELIRSKLKAYSNFGVSGNRGFCADGTTLTKYIWEYLGNPIPPEIYGINSPTNLSVSVVSSNGINLSWQDNSDNEHGFKIERKLGISGQYKQIAIIGSNLTSYVDSGLDPQTMYYYRIRAYSPTLNSMYSNEVYVETATNKTGTASTAVSAGESSGGGGGGGGGGGCFIATACYGSVSKPEVVIMTKFRDEILLKHSYGRCFVRFYYRISPSIAKLISNNDQSRMTVRILLSPVVKLAEYILKRRGIS